MKMNRAIRSRMLRWPYADDGFGNEIPSLNFQATWYFVTGDLW